MRISQNQIRMAVENINYFTSHKAVATFTGGCGIYLTVDGKEYKHVRKDGTGEGLKNKEVMEILRVLK